MEVESFGVLQSFFQIIFFSSFLKRPTWQLERAKDTQDLSLKNMRQTYEIEDSKGNGIPLQVNDCDIGFCINIFNDLKQNSRGNKATLETN